MTRLLYRVVPHNGGLVFAEEERARLIASIHHALETATTWGEFRSMVPPEAYVDCIEDMEFDDEDQTEPDPDEEFDGPVLMSDGDYPPWLQAEMERVIPYELLQRYAKSETTFINGFEDKDPESTGKIWEMIVARYGKERARIAVIN